MIGLTSLIMLGCSGNLELYEPMEMDMGMALMAWHD